MTSCSDSADWQAAAMMGSPGELSVQQGEAGQALLLLCTCADPSPASVLLSAAVLQPEASFHYPPAEASGEDVARDPELFHATLKKVSQRPVKYMSKDALSLPLQKETTAKSKPSTTWCITMYAAH